MLIYLGKKKKKCGLPQNNSRVSQKLNYQKWIQNSKNDDAMVMFSTILFHLM